MRGSARGGNDRIYGGDNSAYDYVYSDSFAMYDHSRGGNDQLFGGSGTKYVRLVGDAANYMYGNAQGGNDQLTGSVAAYRNLLMGDAYSLYDNSRGGNDVPRGGDNVKPGLFRRTFSRLIKTENNIVGRPHPGSAKYALGSASA